MKIYSACTAAAALLSLSACGVPERPVTDGNIKGSFFEDLFGKRCTLEILFGSYASGIDAKSHTEIKVLLDSKNGIFTVEEKPWGREGETAICANSDSIKEADNLEKAVARIIAANEPTRGPVTVTRGPISK